MRAAPGFAPRAIARHSRRIDIAKDPHRRRTSVAEKREPRVNAGGRSQTVVARVAPSKGGARAIHAPISGLPEIGITNAQIG